MRLPKTLLKSIREDSASGSRELLLNLIDGLLGWIPEQSFNQEDIRKLGKAIYEVRTEMGIFQNLARLIIYRHRKSQEDQQQKKLLRNIIRNVKRELTESIKLIESNYREHFSHFDTILTYSRSGTVINLIKNSDTIRNAFVMHSYPGGEGQDTVIDLSDSTEAKFIFDMEVSRYFNKIDSILIGCDQFFSSGEIINKIGTEFLARAADPIPVIVVTDRLKWSYEPDLSSGPTVSSPSAVPPDIQDQHPIFEIVKPHFLDSYVTEDGVFENLDGSYSNLEELREARILWGELMD